MTILYAAGEPADLNLENDLDVASFYANTADSDRRETTYSRCSFGRGSSTKVYAPLASPVSECWFHFCYAPKYNSNSPFSSDVIGLYDASNNKIAALTIDGSTIYKATSTFHAASTQLWSTLSSAVKNVDVYVKMDASAGVIAWYVDGTLIYQFNGDTRGALGDVAKIGFGQTMGYPSSPTGSFRDRNSFLSQLFVADITTVGGKLYTLPPVATGGDDQWTGGVADINHIAINDATSINTDTAGHRESFTVSWPASLPAGLQIAAVRLAFRAARDIASAVNNVQPFVKKSSVNYDAGAAYALTTSVAFVERILETNPVTSAAWVVADLTGLEVGFEATA